MGWLANGEHSLAPGNPYFAASRQDLTWRLWLPLFAFCLTVLQRAEYDNGRPAANGATLLVSVGGCRHALD